MNYKFNGFISYSHAADGRLAPKLQVALEKFAKPWYKLRNLNLFRDESSLSASPQLWSNIQEALDNSEYLLYMASPLSAESKWVRMEIDYFLEKHELNKIIIVLTDGEIQWDENNNTFYNKNDNALPPNLENHFKAEPFYIDLRTAKSQEDISLKNPIFKKEILKLAAHLHDKAPKDMAGEEVLAHRNMIRIRNSAIAVLLFLLLLSVNRTCEAKKQTKIAELETQRARDSSYEAQRQRKIAQDSSFEAQRQRKIAQDSSFEAQRQRDLALAQTKIANSQRDIAQANFLISEAQRETSPTLSILYAKNALKKLKSPENLAIANKIYRKHNFSKSLVISQSLYIQDTIFFVSGDKQFITQGEFEGNDVYAWNGLDSKDKQILFPYLYSNQPLVKKDYVLWTLEGHPLKRFSEDEVLAEYPYLFKNNNQNSKIGIYTDALYITVYNKHDFSIINKIDYHEFAKDLIYLKLSPDSTKLVGLFNNGIINVWDIKTGYRSEYDTRLNDALVSRWHPDRDNINKNISFNFSSDGQKIIVSIPGEIQLWDIGYKNVINSLKFKSYKNCVTFSKDGKSINIFSQDTTYNWSYSTGDFQISKEKKTSCFSENEGKFWFGSIEGYVLDESYGSVISQLDENGNKQCAMSIGYEVVDYFSLTPNKKEIFVATSDTLRFYKNIKSKFLNDPTKCYNNIPLRKFPNELKHAFSKVAFSSDGKFMISMAESYNSFEFDTNASNSLNFTLWDLETGEYTMTFPDKIINNYQDQNFDIEPHQVFLEFSPDNKKILIAYNDEITVWNCPLTVVDYLNSDKLNALEKEKRSRIDIRVWD